MKLKQLLFGMSIFFFSTNTFANEILIKNTSISATTTSQLNQSPLHLQCIKTENIFVKTQTCSNEKYNHFIGEFDLFKSKNEPSLNKFKNTGFKHYFSDFTATSGANYTKIKNRGIKEETANIFYNLETLPFGLEMTLKKWKNYGVGNSNSSFEEKGFEIGPIWAINKDTKFEINLHRFSHEINAKNTWNSEIQLKLSYQKYF